MEMIVENKGGRPTKKGIRMNLVIRVDSREDAKKILDIPTYLRGKILLEWWENNMAHLLEDKDE